MVKFTFFLKLFLVDVAVGVKYAQIFFKLTIDSIVIGYWKRSLFMNSELKIKLCGIDLSVWWIGFNRTEKDGSISLFSLLQPRYCIGW